MVRVDRELFVGRLKIRRLDNGMAPLPVLGPVGMQGMQPT